MSHALHRPRRAALGLTSLLTAVGLTASMAVAAPLGPGTVGSPGVGDPYFPNYGNGGYDAIHYTIRVDYDVRTERLKGNSTIAATATQDLTRFNLDLSLPASKVFVDGVAATFTQGRHELVVTPASPITSGDAFAVRVVYAGKPGAISTGGIGAWFETADGAIAAGEPEISALWFPANDHPSDKATFDLFIRTNKGSQAISNGELLDRTPAGGDVTWHWRVTEPMATYLATAVIGDYDLERGTTPGGTPYLYGITQHLAGGQRRAAVRSLRITPRVVDFYSETFGAYPFSSTGGTLVNADFGFSLENQTRPNYSKVFFGTGPTGEDHEVIAHELAHMWWGDSVSVAQWRHIWLNEGFATWSSWRYLVTEPRAGYTLNEIFKANYDALVDYKPFWKVVVSDPGAGAVFDFAVYYRGAMALQALRNRIGVADHTELLRRWASERQYGNGTVLEFEALAEEVSGENLDTFFAEWLDQANRPLPSLELGFPPSMVGRQVPGERGADGPVPPALVARPGARLPH